MIKTFTYDDVVRYACSETTHEESEQIAQALLFNDDLMSFYIDTLEIRKQMNLLSYQPSNKMVRDIMAYSALSASASNSLPAVAG